jgi:FkbM family methyltransferase
MTKFTILRERLICRLLRLFRIRRRRNLGSIALPYDLGAHSIYAYALHDSYDIPLMVLMRERLREGGVFVDVGANIGYVAAVGMNRVGRLGSVIAFEPVARHCALLRALGELNPDYKLRVEQLALGERPGEAEIAISADNIGWNTMVPGFMTEAGHASERVAVVRFDDYAHEHGLGRIDLVKIDVEGYELPVLKGMRRTLVALRPPIHLECAPQAYSLLGGSVADLAVFLAEIGYQARDAQTLGLVDPATIRSTTNLLLTARGGEDGRA